MAKRMRRNGRRPSERWGPLAVAVLWLTWACAGDEAWGELRWPNDRPGAPTQPRLEQTGLILAVEAMRWEPEAVAVELHLVNTGTGSLQVETAGILLAWDDLEFPQRDATAPASVALDAGEQATVALRYRLGRPLTAVGAKLIVRTLSRDGVAQLEPPTVPLPPLPVSG